MIAWLDDLAGPLARATHPGLDWVKPRIAEALETMRPMVLEPDEREGQRIAGGMARVAQATLLMEAAAWRNTERDDRSALIATEMITRAQLIPARTVDMDLQALACADAGVFAAP